eukprot:GHVN01019518.1.p1 GENE.GHVN01019518.1~~GHVN01019518.1.p1  ORF type:complete len:124 (+),score=18.80 GHVN01019518.1:397-768(+)
MLSSCGLSHTKTWSRPLLTPVATRGALQWLRGVSGEIKTTASDAIQDLSEGSLKDWLGTTAEDVGPPPWQDLRMIAAEIAVSKYATDEVDAENEAAGSSTWLEPVNFRINPSIILRVHLPGEK